jgi:plasmid stabilization system protein ParE
MSKWDLTPRARRDLFEIWDYIANDNPTAADRIEQAVFNAFDLLAESPLAGHTRKEVTALPLRFWVLQPYANYFIVYDPIKKPIQIVRILHAARDLPFALG